MKSSAVSLWLCNNELDQGFCSEMPDNQHDLEWDEHGVCWWVNQWPRRDIQTARMWQAYQGTCVQAQRGLVKWTHPSATITAWGGHRWHHTGNNGHTQLQLACSSHEVESPDRCCVHSGTLGWQLLFISRIHCVRQLSALHQATYMAICSIAESIIETCISQHLSNRCIWPDYTDKQQD